MTSQNRNSTKTRPASTGNSRTKSPGKTHKTRPTGLLGLYLDYEDPPVPGTEGLDLDDPERVRLEYEHATTLAPGESWLTLTGFQDRVDQPPSHPKSADEHAADGGRIYWWEVERRKDPAFRQQERDAARAAGRSDPYPGPLPPVVADASNHHLVAYLQIALGTCGCDVSHPDYAGPTRNSTFYELAEEHGWSGDFLAGAHRLAEEMGLLGISTDSSDEKEPQDMGTEDDDVVKDYAKEKAKRNSKANSNSNSNSNYTSNASPSASATLKKHKDKKKPFHLWVAETFFGMMDEDGDDLKMVRDKNDVEQMWHYNAKTSLWSIIRDEAIFLDRKMQAAVIQLENPNKSNAKLLAEARKHVMVHKRLYPKNITFDAHGLVPIKRFLIDPSTRQRTQMTRDHYCTWCIDVAYDPDAKCPHWLQLMNDAFADRDDVERKKTIELLQDKTGVSLVDKKDKALRRTICIYGPSNTGKTSLIEVMSGVSGIEPISTSLTELAGPFGLEEFTRRANWVLHEAFDQGTWHISSRAKLVISGNKISINGKNRKAYTTEINTDGFWATNHGPKFREATRAMIERLLVVETKQVFDPKHPVGVAVEANKQGFKTPEAFILATERPGILNWALDGAKRALENRCFKDTVAGEAALEEIHRDANAIKGFLEDCTEYDCDKMVSTPDLQLAYISWYQETKGEDQKVPSPDLLGRSLRALADPRIAQDNAKFRDDKGVRFYPGIVLNKIGCDHWQTKVDEINQAGPTRSSSKSAGRISSTMTVARGKDIPDTDTWNKHPLIKQIRALAKAEHEKTKKQPKF